MYSVAAVLKELQDRDDDLAKWATGLGKRMFLGPDRSVENTHSKIREWAQQEIQYRSQAVDEFLTDADSFLVAHAKAHGHALVTLEQPAEMTKNRVPIPNACTAFGVEWLGPFDMLEREGARFVMAGP